MKEALRISWWCLIAACVLNTAFCFAQDAVWLQLNCHNKTGVAELKPRQTVIISSVRPSVKQLAENRWQISFIP
jgi:hypothetical protein